MTNTDTGRILVFNRASLLWRDNLKFLEGFLAGAGLTVLGRLLGIW